MPMIRFGIQIEPQFGFTFDDVVDIARTAEQTGCHALWSSDHLLWDEHSEQRNCIEAWTLLTALAPLTTTLRLGTLVTCNSYRHPSLLAKTVACLDSISRGRIDCGLGAGWKELEYRAYGIPFPSVSVRMAQLGEAVQVLKRLWTHDQVSFQGQYYQLDNATCRPKPVQNVLPLWIGGQGEKKLLRLVAEAADGWNMVMGSSLQQVRHKLNVLQQHCDAVGRDIASIDKSLFILTYLFDSEQEYRRILSEQARLLGPDGTASLQHACQLGLAGSAEQVTDTLAQYLACGFDYIVALFPYTRERDMLQRYAEEVRPHLT
ncbi:MAG: TIGR03560 family F420-dependent LLM class oxidoreductase [bacterium]|nr:TIGR03560 family F420-dependent LLM class oxidoreductase [bacterium]